LTEQKEYSQLKSALPPSNSPGDGKDPNPDASGPQNTGIGTGGKTTGTPFDVLGTFRNVSNYQSEGN